MNDTAPASNPATPELPDTEEWKPEPRTWAWKDLFTAPMLAFKPKCMLISAATLAIVVSLAVLWMGLLSWLVLSGSPVFVNVIVLVLGIILAAIVLNVGASLVAVFMKADLLDDEFLSLKEGLGQFRSRILPAILVPAFLAATVIGFLLLIYLGMLLCSLPYVGSLLYMILYPFGYLLALLTILIGIAVILSLFLVPSIVAIRKHGWFDNVIDTFEAVGTKPHVVVLNLALSILVALIAFSIAHGSMLLLSSASALAPGSETARSEARAQQIKQAVAHWTSPWGEDEFIETSAEIAGAKVLISNHRRAGRIREQLQELRREGRELQALRELERLQEGIEALTRRLDRLTPEGQEYQQLIESLQELRRQYEELRREEREAFALAQRIESLGKHQDQLYSAHPGFFYQWGPGLVVGIWQSILLLVISGYTLNILIAGGMLTYLFVREDDYWDDEDLEDLDKLAKELEEEAKAEAAQATNQPDNTAAPVAATEEDDSRKKTALSDDSSEEQGSCCCNGEQNAEDCSKQEDCDAGESCCCTGGSEEGDQKENAKESSSQADTEDGEKTEEAASEEATAEPSEGEETSDSEPREEEDESKEKGE